MGLFDVLKKVANHVAVKVHSKEQGGGGTVLVKTGSPQKKTEPTQEEIDALDRAIEEWEKQCKSNSSNIGPVFLLIPCWLTEIAWEK